MDIIRIRTIFAPAADLVRVRIIRIRMVSPQQVACHLFKPLVFPLTHIGMAAVCIYHDHAQTLHADTPDTVVPFGDLVF